MPDYRAIARKAARRYGIPEWWFMRQLNQESHFIPGQTSGAGAKWIGQFIPSTARQYGVHDDISSIFGAAHYDADLLRRYGTPARALSAYNSGRPDAYKDPNFAHGQTYHYVRNILSGAPDIVPSRPAAAPTDAMGPGAAAAPLPGLGDAARFVLNAGNKMFGVPQIAAAAGPPVLSPAAIPPGLPQDVRPQAPAAAPGKWVRFAPGADRKGVATSPAVTSFVARIGQSYGRPLTIGTGTNHNQFVLGTHRESQHWTGHAADIPASGSDLLRLGRLALIAAGMPRAQAMKQTGGVYNIGKFQILFRTMVGGSHFDHLHVGVR